jgi:hypothetical protein
MDGLYADLRAVADIMLEVLVDMVVDMAAVSPLGILDSET